MEIIFIRCYIELSTSVMIPQGFTEPEDAFQVQNWHIILDFLVILLAFFLLTSSFLDLLTVFLSKIR